MELKTRAVYKNLYFGDQNANHVLGNLPVADLKII